MLEHRRLIDMLDESHALACSQGKRSMAELLLSAMKTEAGVAPDDKRKPTSEEVLAAAETRHEGRFEDEVDLC